MALNLKAIFVSVPHGSYNTSVVESFGSGFLQVSGVTANYPLVLKLYLGNSPVNVTTRGFGYSDNDGNAMIPFRANDSYTWSASGTFSFILATTAGASVATYSGNNFQDNYEHTNAGIWNFTQDSSKSVKAQIVDYQSVTTYTVFESYESGVLETPQFFKIWEVKMFGPDGSLLQTNNLTPRPDGQQPFTVFPGSIVSVTGEYFFSVSRKYRLTQASTSTSHLEGTFSTVLTASTVTSTSTNMYSWLDNSYWYLTDLQVNLGTRAVTHRHGTIQLRPSDTINFAILFHDGTAGIDPQATDIKLAVRSSNNTSPYHFWSAATVSTVTVSGDVYYAITVTASDDDLLTAQAANLLAESNADQSLLGEIQWTTTRGTFSSDTFTINVPSEVVREPDV